MLQRFNLQNIRALLTEGFTDEELRRLCYDVPDFRHVYDQLARNTGKSEIIDRLIEHADRRLQVEILLTLVEKSNPARFEKHKPYTEVSLFPSTFSMSEIPHNLPNPDYIQFVGREEEAARLHELLSWKSRAWVIVIDGIGGIGKSALALELGHYYLRDYHRISPENRFEAIIWTSAKQTVLTAEGIKTRHQVLRTLDDIYMAIAAALQREDITRARPEEQAEVVRNALTRQRTLLIVDNLETVDDEAVLNFLRELPAPTKAIVTTRHRLDVAYPVRLVGMPWEDAQKLITQEGEKKGVSLNQDETHHLYKRTGGVPLALVWSVAQMGLGYGIEAVLTRLGQPSNDIARFCFEGAVERIRGKSAHKLLLALALFAAAASREALGYVTDLPELDRDEGLVELEKLSLVNRQAGRFSLLPLTRSFLMNELKQLPEFTTSAFEQALKYYEQLITPALEIRIGVPYWDGLINYAQAESLEQEWVNLAQFIRQTLDQHLYQAALNLFLPVVHFLHIWGLWDERLQLSREMCQAAHELGDSAEVWLWIDAIGFILRERHQFDECLQALKTGKLLAQQFNLDDASLLADVYEANLYTQIGDIDFAQQKIENSLRQVDLNFVLEHGSPIRRIIIERVIRMAALLSRLQQDFVREKELYEYDLALRRSIGENPAPALSSLAYVSLKLNDVGLAVKFLGEALATAKQKDMGWINYELAVVAEKKGEFQEARRLGVLALEKFTYLKLEDLVQECQAFLARLPK